MCCAENVMKGKWDHEGEDRRCDHDGQKRLEMFCTPIPRSFCVALAWRVALHKSRGPGGGSDWWDTFLQDHQVIFSVFIQSVRNGFVDFRITKDCVQNDP